MVGDPQLISWRCSSTEVRANLREVQPSRLRESTLVIAMFLSLPFVFYSMTQLEAPDATSNIIKATIAFGAFLAGVHFLLNRCTQCWRSYSVIRTVERERFVVCQCCKTYYSHPTGHGHS